jgi:CRP/FNR family cyclic AMP-dependent transcriptional regulator
LLEHIRLFAGLPAEDIGSIERHGAVRTLRKNTIFIEKGQEASSLYVILSGRVKVYVADEGGKEKILAVQGPGDYLGDLSLLGDCPRTASAATLEDSSFLVLSKADFLECLGRNPQIALNLIRDLVSLANRLTEAVSDLALRDVYGRLVRVLEEQAVEADGQRVTRRLTQREIASMIGASREMVSILLRDLKGGGYISVDGKRIRILRKLPPRW